MNIKRKASTVLYAFGIIFLITAVIVVLGYYKVFDNIVLIKSDTNVKNELSSIESLLDLQDNRVKRTTVKRFKGRTTFYGHNLERQASATGYYQVDDLNLDKWLKYRQTLLKNYSTDEKIRTGCDDNPTKGASCEVGVSVEEGEAIFSRDWDIPIRAHMSCYKGPVVENTHLTACLSVSPGKPYEYSEYSEEHGFPANNVNIQILEGSPFGS